MMKGVSPVVATVLLIAIAVVAAVAVWFWVGAMGRPAVPAQEIKHFTVEKCIVGANQSIKIYNNGAQTVYNATIRLLSNNLDQLDASVGGFPTSLAPGARATLTTAGTLVVGTSYNLEYPGIPLVPFGC